MFSTGNIIMFLFIAALALIFYFVLKAVIKVLRRRKELNESEAELISTGYKLQEEYTAGEFDSTIAYDLKAELLFYILPDQPSLKIPFRKIADCTVLVNSYEHEEFRVSNNVTRFSIDDNFDHWIKDTRRNYLDLESVELLIELKGFTPDHIKIEFLYTTGGEDSDIGINKKLIRWFKVIRKIIENNQN